ncbi:MULTISPECIES: EAL domain-containing response regulator [Cyanophyceae]|uniref:two-component system response regulator n=1 Tax=Cyanophyceae TaxID=3028117 RepID=UPI0002FF9A4F|nr:MULTISPECIES: EAL domain-containing response regulator [Cyanophyceae]SMH47552.1 response regulator receiver modulated diguanylate cyclase/phosphodiesterase [Picosynechococcus sp. OG1]SMQ81027.1 diguanylate cyclase (GGDEF) domain-containing protein [Synechococcus sp. 7002]
MSLNNLPAQNDVSSGLQNPGEITTILVIEDDYVIRKLTRKILTNAGYIVIEANDGEKGIQAAKEYHPDLIICDVMMPHLSGYDVLARLQQQEATEMIPFIFLTAQAEGQQLRQGMASGADDYLMKPIQAAELLKAVEVRLNKYSKVKQYYSEQLNQLSEKDSLTGLPNQNRITYAFEKVVAQLPLGQEDSETVPSTPLLSIGLDRFQLLNEYLGHGIVSALLKQVGDRLQQTLEKYGTVVSLNTSEFCAILHPLEHRHEIVNIAEEILAAFSSPFTTEDQQDVFISLSIGIALYIRDGITLDELLSNAHTAMLRVQKQGGNQHAFYSVAMNVGRLNTVSLEADLRQALERNELEVVYQPKMNLQTGKVVGAEALLRWFHPTRGLVLPNQFISLAEETGLIIPIGEYVMEEACCQLRRWQLAGLKDFYMSINLSAKQFTQLNLHHRLSQIMINNQLQPQDIQLELTESTLVNNGEVSIRRLKALRSLGLKIALDDFGTGYSSLSYLQQFSFDTLKLDRSFIHGIHRNHVNATIITAIIEMAHNLNLKVVAEGVEDEGELEFLTRFNCDEIQGFLFSRPIKAEEFLSSPFMDLEPYSSPFMDLEAYTDVA